MPISDIELNEIAVDVESDRVERKEALTDRGRAGQAVCAFANDLPGHGLPGYLLIGVADDGTPTDLAITDQLLQNLGGLRDDGDILPVPSITVTKRQVAGVEVALVEVLPSTAPPVRYKGEVWIRVGPRRAKATPEEETRLAERRRGADLPFDARDLQSSTLEDLDLDLFQQTYLPSALSADVLAANNRSVEHQLAALRFATPGGTPTVAGMITVGREPQVFVPGAYVQLTRFDGQELSDDVVTAHTITGPLPNVLRELDELLRINIRTAVDLTSGTVETRQADYPLVALQQLTRNAIMHRTYETSTAPARISWFTDRVEIQNPGGPYGQVTIENFGTEGVTDYRNPTIAEAMRGLGYVQRFGVGIATARRALMEAGNPELEFQLEPTYIAAIIRSI